MSPTRATASPRRREIVLSGRPTVRNDLKPRRGVQKPVAITGAKRAEVRVKQA